MSNPGDPAAAAPPAPSMVGPRPATSALSWALGFLAYIPIPFLNLVITGIVMAAVYPSVARKGPRSLAAANARSAANWGLTLITVMLVLVIAFIALMSALSGRSVGFFPIGSPVVVYLVLSIAHLVVTIVGTVKATRGSAFRNPLAIPYLR